MKHTLFVIFCALLFVACAKKKENTTTNTQTNDSTKQGPVIVDVTLKEPQLPIEDTIATIELDNMTLVFNRNPFYMDDADPIVPTDDTITLYEDLGGNIQGAWLTIKTDQLAQIIVEQRFETSASLSFEGPHCDMIDWKHYNSPWKQLKKNANGDYLIDTISYNDGQLFPKVTEKEFKAAIIKYCGKESLKKFEGKIDPYTYPSNVGISRIFIKITALERATHNTVTRVLEIIVPMGC